MEEINIAINYCKWIKDKELNQDKRTDEDFEDFMISLGATQDELMMFWKLIQR